jgi:predicted nucleotidyltransferase
VTGFTPEQAAVLRSLRGIWPEEQFVVVGATALGCHIDLEWRTTRDLDVTITADIEQCRATLALLPGWIRHEHLEHDWIAPGGVRVDVIPASAAALASGRIDWPSGHTMSAVGLRAAFEDNIRLGVGEQLFVRVAAAAAITILKMAASLDRPERERDVADLAHLMERIVDDDDPERWSDSVIELGLDYELVSPFVLGRRVATVANKTERELVERFLTRLEDPSDRSASLARMSRMGPMAWRNGDEAVARLQAFRRGFDSSPAGIAG